MVERLQPHTKPGLKDRFWGDRLKRWKCNITALLRLRCAGTKTNGEPPIPEITAKGAGRQWLARRIGIAVREFEPQRALDPIALDRGRCNVSQV
jgi:hypothetical protein